MKSFISIVLLLFASGVFAQQDTTNRDRTLDGIHLRSKCVVDTSLVFHYNKSLVLKDSSNLIYEFVPGNKIYAEVWVRSTVCLCKDCSFSHHVIVDISTLKETGNLILTKENTVWISMNSMMISTLEKSFTGSIKLLGKNLVVMELLKFLPANPELIYDGMKVVKEIN